MLGTAMTSSFEHSVDETAEHYYIVSAVDENENEGNYSEVVNVSLMSMVNTSGLPDSYALHQNYPNPFNPETNLRFDLPEDMDVSIDVFDMLGRKVSSLLSQRISAGYHTIKWNGTNSNGASVAAGVYIYTIQAGEYRDLKKMIYLK